MMSTQLSTCLTVADFFTQANWQGLKITPTAQQTVVETIAVDNLQTPSLNLSLADFFTRNNWRGEKQVITRLRQEEEGIDYSFGLTPSLKTTVAEFFQRMVWHQQQKPNIATMPKVKTPKTPTFKPESLNVNDLSNLF